MSQPSYDDYCRPHHPDCLVHEDNIEESEALLAADEITAVECNCEDLERDAQDFDDQDEDE